jgi:hypothetical protein
MSNKIEITVEFKKILQILKDDKKRDTPLFISGAAGTGKSELIKKVIRREFPGQVCVCAPTGVAAQNVLGVTRHRLFNHEVYPASSETTDPRKDFNNSNREPRIEEDEWIVVIDEISMIDAGTIDLIQKQLQHCYEKEKKWGGKKVVFIGDLFQLPPIDTEYIAYKKDYGNHPHFFYKAHSLEEGFEYVELTKVFRQKSDEEFREALTKLRKGKRSEDVLKYINRNAAIIDPSEVSDDCVFLSAQNKYVDNHNSRKLRTIKGDTISITGEDGIREINGSYSSGFIYKFIGGEKHSNYFKTREENRDNNHITKEDLRPDGVYRLPAPIYFEFKIGARVMLSATQSGNLAHLVNGTLGEIVSITLKGGTIINQGTRPSQRNLHVDEVESIQFKVYDNNNENYQVYDIPPKEWDLKEQEEYGTISGRISGQYKQVPFRLGYAITVHKSQGLTLEKVFIDLTAPQREAILYVALSRLKSINGLSLSRKITLPMIKAMTEIANFYDALSYDQSAACYEIYLKEKRFQQLIEKYNINKDEFKLIEVEGEKYLSLYVGETRNLRRRYMCHFLDEYPSDHTESCFRRSMHQLINDGVIEAPYGLSDFLKNECLFKPEYFDNTNDAKTQEKNALKKHFFPLNIKNNPKAQDLEEIHQIIRGTNSNVVTSARKKKAIVLMCTPKKRGRTEDVHYIGDFNFTSLDESPIKRTPLLGDYQSLQLKSLDEDNINGTVFRASQLYKHPLFKEAHEHCNNGDFYVFSAGWGIISGNSHLPHYDITFNPGAAGDNKETIRDISLLDQDDFPNIFEINLENYEKVEIYCTKDYVQYLGYLFKQHIIDSSVPNNELSKVHIFCGAGRNTIIDSIKKHASQFSHNNCHSLYSEIKAYEQNKNVMGNIAMWEVFKKCILQ